MIQDNEAPKADQGKNRKAIRKKIVELLKNKTLAQERVYPNASIPISLKAEEDETPAILVYPRAEGASEYAMAPRELERSVDMIIEILASGVEENALVNDPAETTLPTVEDLLDDIAQQIEDILEPDDSLGGTADASILTNTEFEFDSDGGVPIGSCRMTFTITYYTMSPRDITLQGVVDDLKSHSVEHNIGDDPDTREATDTVTVP